MTNEEIKCLIKFHQEYGTSARRETVTSWSEEDKLQGLEFLASKGKTVQDAIDFLDQMVAQADNLPGEVEQLERELDKLSRSKRVELAAQFMAALLSDEPYGLIRAYEELATFAFKAADAFLAEAKKHDCQD